MTDKYTNPMKRIQEKVKDLIEVRSYKSLLDFISDPAQTVSIYHFTEITSELMAKCLDKVAAIQTGGGAAAALAGYRGVGKSHFLATLGAIVSHPELRLRVTDAHVAASIQLLKRARHPVAYVRRGTHETLFEELKQGIAKTFEIDAASLSNSLGNLLEFAARKAGELPFVLIIDTAFERTARVARDDGILLGEIAETAKNLNIFVAVALDDDIAGADGINAAIARNFTIDYLDTEHLYRIVDTNIFPKHRQMSPLLHEIYLNFKEVMPYFRWSEQRFTSLYPLHPVILETAPFVRLYAPEFALLSFTSEAGDKIQGRPANSLIALDEVFDTVEASLRKVEDLREAVTTYDKINQQVVTQIPVMQRLQAKLILKGLFLLSLEGNGTSAGEIGAAMLIYDENDPPKAVKTVEDLLETFAAAFPNEIQRITAEGRENQYSLKVGSKENLNNAIAEAVKLVAPDAATEILRRAAGERFADWTIAENQTLDSTDCQTFWRGGMRRGRIIWNLENNSGTSPIESADAKLYDWEVIVSHFSENDQRETEIPRVFWRPALLRPDETDTILRYHVLLTDNGLREEYGEQLRAAGHANLMAVEKIWNRVFLEEATLEIEDFDYNFSDEARAAQTLAEVFSNMLEPLFESRYPEHPRFAEPLGMWEVSQLGNDFFSGARQDLPESQHLAEIFALPLGLVARRGSLYVIESEENLINLPFARNILSLVKENPEKEISLETIYRQLKQPPFGLVREAQHLILTALVAQRRIEFVTTKGDRINRRSLDLKIIWDDIQGVAKPSSVLYADRRLIEWVKVLTGASAVQSIDTPNERQTVKTALEKWLTDWQSARVLERFHDLPDENLNTKIWRLATHAEKTFGMVAATVRAILDETLSLEEGLHRIADAFSDSEKEFYTRRTDLTVIEDFIGGAAMREKVWNYLAICETTPDEKIEHYREKLISLVEDGFANPSEKLNAELENLWRKYHRQFSEHFAVKHDSVMKSHYLQDKFKEILESDEWWEFANLSRLTIFQKVYWKEAQRIQRQLKDLNCRFDVTEMLKTQPFCACSFNLAQIWEWENLPFALEEIITRGRRSYRKILQMLNQTIVSAVEHFTDQNSEEEFLDASVRLIEIFTQGAEIPLLTNHELVILQKIFESLPTSPLISVSPPTEDSFLSGEELRYQVNDWLDNLPSEPVLLKF
ncbi:MAG: hypothetical protein LH614_22535 [Pyrinomonadaceae bacterium]|nr:hypothetical protein [Pyrinomonadaceae bacterium]